MNHQAPEGNLSDYLDDQLQKAHRSDWRVHLAQCGACRAELGELAVVRGAAREWQPAPMAGNRWSSIAAQISRDKAHRKKPVRRRSVAASAFGLLIAASLAVIVSRSRVAVPLWPQEVLSAEAKVALLEQTANEIMDDLSPDLRDRLRALLAQIDSSLSEIESSRSRSTDPSLIADIRLAALNSKQEFLETVHDLFPRPARTPARAGG